MTVVRTIPALHGLLGMDASLETLADLIRNHLRTLMTAEECETYRGITHTGFPSHPDQVFLEVSNVETPEDLIIAEETGAFWIPADRPGKVYLFACEKGAVASAAWTALKFDPDGTGREPQTKDTFEELHARYRTMPTGNTLDREKLMAEVAHDFVKWACKERYTAASQLHDRAGSGN